MKRWIVGLAVVLVAFAATAQGDTITHGGTTINMDFVAVGNAGNPGEQSRLALYGDTNYYGAVGYKYQIGKYEVTAAQWAAVRAADSSVGNAGSWTGSWPTARTSWHEAARFCNWLTTGSANSGYYTISGGEATPNALGHDAYAAVHDVTYFIPTENEWYKAAYHKNNGVTGGVDNYWNYPTASDSVPVGIRFFQDTPFDAVFSQEYDQGQPNAVDNAGVPSPYGTIGQGGNVWELNETLIYGSRGFLGGSWYDGYIYLSASYRGYMDPSDENFSVGFRVASVPGGYIPVAGDANCDGKVDDLDASILAANWQRTGGATWAQADFNDDHNVNDLDASILAADWQAGVGAAVPEPSTLALSTGIAVMGLVYCLRRKAA